MKIASLRSLVVLLFGTTVLLGTTVLAAPPAEFALRYDARLGNLRAESDRSLVFNSATNTWHMQAQSKVLLLGASLSTITENASFQWQNDLPLPLAYSFDQSGVGARSRSVRFDQQNKLIHFQVDEDTGMYPLNAPVYDDLSAYIVLSQQLQQGAKEVFVEVLDRGEIETYHYRVIDEANLQTALGDFPVVHVERIRDSGSKRRTEFWLAREHHYLLLKLVQQEPNGQTLSLDVASATLNGAPLQAGK